MNFSVQWRASALATLAHLWTQSDDRQSITLASNRLDRRLATDPMNEGESRNEDERISFEYPLQILFRVDEPRREVNVTAIGLIGSRS